MTWKEALEASIKIWRKRAAGKDVDDPCPLCEKTSPKHCSECPAGENSSRGMCFQEFYTWADSRKRTDAKAVLELLIGLRKHPKCRIETENEKKPCGFCHRPKGHYYSCRIKVRERNGGRE